MITDKLLIPLTEDDFEVKYRGHTEDYKTIIIQSSNQEFPKNLKQQILENQKLRQLIDEEVKSLDESMERMQNKNTNAYVVFLTYRNNLKEFLINSTQKESTK